MTEVAEMMAQVQTDIYAEDYYVNLYREVLRQRSVTHDQISSGALTDEQVVSLANRFWERLPDSMAIRRDPFFVLCDVASWDYRDEEP